MLIKILKRIFSTVFGLLAIILVGISAYEILFMKTIYNLDGIFFSFTVIGILSWLSAALLSSSFLDAANKRKSMRYGCILFFTFYCLILINLLFTGGRNFSINSTPTMNFSHRLDLKTNFVPFRTILRYINGSDHYSQNIIIQNIAGNIFLLAPMGLFLPVLFSKLKQFRFYILFVFLGILVIETTQFFTNLGTFDIDDIILNLSGAVLFFFVCKLKPIQWFLRKMRLIG